MPKRQIIVQGKDDLGYSPKFGSIVKGQQYTIDEDDFSDQLFELVKTKQNPPEAPAETGGP